MLASTIFLITISCGDPKTKSDNWSANLHTLGTYSSIKSVDLNQDNILDLVIGAGKNEFEKSDSAVVAINGQTGKLLWTYPGTDQVVGSAIFHDMNGDNVPDVIIGGRNAQLKVISGNDGSKIWEYSISNHKHDAKGYMRFNFFNPQVIPDQNHDGVNDLLVSNGGNIRAYKKNGEDRYPGVLGVLSGKTGEIIAADTIPDGKETYMSPLVFDNKDGGKSIIYGSGGETLGGHLYEATLEDLMNNDLSTSKVLLSKEGNGFVAPANLADINRDGSLDIIVNWHGGETIAIDGETQEIIWQVKFENTELNSSPVPGDVTLDGIPDYFSSFSIGKWPKNKGSVQVVMDGSDGSILYQDTFGCTGFSSALSYDLNNDNASEFIVCVNDFNCNGIYLGDSKSSILSIDVANNSIDTLVAPSRSKNIGTTPWLGDLDGDNKLDLVYCLQANYGDIYSYYGIQLSRIVLDTEWKRGGSWTEYMGCKSDGIYRE